MSDAAWRIEQRAARAREQRTQRALTDTCPRCAPHGWHGLTCPRYGCACPTAFEERQTA